MGIFNSYVKLPEGTKHLEQWHDQTPHISPPWHGSFPSRVNPYQTILPLVAAWNLHFPPEELLASFGYIDTSSVLVSTSLNHISGSTIWRYIKIDDTIYLNHIIIYLHMLPVTIFTPYLFGGKYTTPSVGARLKGPRNLRSKWGREIWSRAGLESDSRRFHWYSSQIYLSSHRDQIDTCMIYHDISWYIMILI